MPREARRRRRGPASKPEKFAGLAKINMSTGEIQHIYKGRAPGNGACSRRPATWCSGAISIGKFRAFDAVSGKMLWETTLGGTIKNSTITYAVNGKQYIAVMSGEGTAHGRAHHAGRHPAGAEAQ